MVCPFSIHHYLDNNDQRFSIDNLPLISDRNTPILSYCTYELLIVSVYILRILIETQLVILTMRNDPFTEIIVYDGKRENNFCGTMPNITNISSATIKPSASMRSIAIYVTAASIISILCSCQLLSVSFEDQE